MSDLSVRRSLNIDGQVGHLSDLSILSDFHFLSRTKRTPVRLTCFTPTLAGKSDSRTISTLSSQLELNIIHHDSIIAIDSTAIIKTTEAWGAFIALRKVVGYLKAPLKVVASPSLWTLNCCILISIGWRKPPRTLEMKLWLNLR